MHVLDWPVDDEPVMQRLDAPEFRLPFDASVKRRLDELITDDVRTWAEPATVVTHGKPDRRILEIAAQDNTDLIVMGVRGRNPLDLMLFGSTTNHVVRQASCPVLTLKAVNVLPTATRGAWRFADLRNALRKFRPGTNSSPLYLAANDGREASLEP